MYYRIKKTAPFLLVAAFFISLDRFFKILAFNYFQGKEFELLGEYFKFTFAKNYFIAFSLPVSEMILLFLIPIIIFLVFWNALKFFQANEKIAAFFLVFIALGAISNYFDRIKYGFVIDYFDLKYFAVFNLADALIVISALALIVYSFKKA